MKKALLFWLILLANAAMAQTTTLSFSTGSPTSWSISSLSSTITKAGKNYEHTETSSSAQTLLKVSSILAWTISAHLSVTSNWNSALKLSVIRTGPGTGLAIVSGGTTYMQLTTSPQAFFTGALNLGGNRDAIPVQYKLEGLSVTLPAKTYTATVTYTVSGL